MAEVYLGKCSLTFMLLAKRPRQVVSVFIKKTLEIKYWHEWYCIHTAVLKQFQIMTNVGVRKGGGISSVYPGNEQNEEWAEAAFRKVSIKWRHCIMSTGDVRHLEKK